MFFLLLFVHGLGWVKKDSFLSKKLITQFPHFAGEIEKRSLISTIRPSVHTNPIVIRHKNVAVRNQSSNWGNLETTSWVFVCTENVLKGERRIAIVTWFPWPSFPQTEIQNWHVTVAFWDFSRVVRTGPKRAYVPYSEANRSQVIFRCGIQFSRGLRYHTRCVDDQMRIKPLGRPMWVNFASQDWLFLDLPGISEARNYLEISCEVIYLVSKA